MHMPRRPRGRHLPQNSQWMRYVVPGPYGIPPFSNCWKCKAVTNSIHLSLLLLPFCMRMPRKPGGRRLPQNSQRMPHVVHGPYGVPPSEAVENVMWTIAYICQGVSHYVVCACLADPVINFIQLSEQPLPHNFYFWLSLIRADGTAAVATRE